MYKWTTIEKGIEFPISDCNTYIKNPRVEYDGDHNKFGVFYKSSNGSGASLIFRTIDASTKSIGIKNEFGVKTFSDPYEKNIFYLCYFDFTLI